MGRGESIVRHINGSSTALYCHSNGLRIPELSLSYLGALNKYSSRCSNQESATKYKSLPTFCLLDSLDICIFFRRCTRLDLSYIKFSTINVLFTNNCSPKKNAFDAIGNSILKTTAQGKYYYAITYNIADEISPTPKEN